MYNCFMIKRDFYLQKLRDLKDANIIKVITGARRVGKSTLLEQFRRELFGAGIDKQHVLYYNLEDKKNEKYLQDESLLHDTIIKKTESGRGKYYVFIDEVQQIPEFERTLDSLFIRENIDLYITGSNAYVTSSELSTLLSGRYIEIKMQPLTFSEYVKFFKDSKNTAELFAQFVQYGGFPEVANLLNGGLKVQVKPYLNAIYDTVIQKDISVRREVRNLEDFRNVVSYIMNNVGNISSPNNISNILRAEDKVINKQTVANYLDSMIDCSLIYRAKRYDIQGKQLLKTLEKYYTVDTGLANEILGAPRDENLGHQIENIVFLELQKRYGEVRIGMADDKEIDFVVRNEDNMPEYFQVALSATSETTLERELSPLRRLNDNYRKTILTLDFFATDERGILRRNLIDWLLDVKE